MMTDATLAQIHAWYEANREKVDMRKEITGDDLVLSYWNARTRPEIVAGKPLLQLAEVRINLRMALESAATTCKIHIGELEAKTE